MSENIITISGKPGCGKTTMANILSKKLGYKILSSGEKFREIAKQHNMNIVDFVVNYLPFHDEIDLKIDNFFIDYARNNNNIIIPTRVLGCLLQKNNIDSFNIYLFAETDIRINRIMSRENSNDINLIKKDLKKREYAENKKYNKIYNIDINDLSVYNLVIYTHFLPGNIGFVKIIFNNIVQYIKADNTLPDVLSGIIIDKYNEFKNLNFK